MLTIGERIIMSTTEVALLNQKLDILIGDFQAHRKQSVKQEQIAEIKGTLRMHSVIGGFAITTVIGCIVAVYIG